MKRFMGLLLVMVLSIFTIVGCSSDTDDTGSSDSGSSEETSQEVGEIILATTTSTQDSGLLDHIIPIFEEETGGLVKTVAVGTGKALEMGENGEADVLLVHAKEREEELVEAGHGTYRKDVMYNDFVLVGPSEDPLNLSEASKEDIVSAFKNISNAGEEFVSRGDDSGTHTKELGVWEEAGIEPSGEWYVEAGAGMADVLKIASEKQAYTLTDRATYLNLKDTLDLEILVEGDEILFNQYGVIPVSPDKEGVEINNYGAEAFVEWITSDEIQEVIGEYGTEDFGQPLFVPNAE